MIVYNYISVTSETIQVLLIRACVLLRLITKALAWEHRVLMECIKAYTNHFKVPISPIRYLNSFFINDMLLSCTLGYFHLMSSLIYDLLYKMR